MDGIDISGAEKCMGVPVAAQPVGQADTCVAPHAPHEVLWGFTTVGAGCCGATFTAGKGL